MIRFIYLLLAQTFCCSTAFGEYRSFDEVQKVSRRLTSLCQANIVCNYEAYGQTREGRSLFAIEIGDFTVAKPVIQITAATHGDELITTEALLRYLENLIPSLQQRPLYRQVLEVFNLAIIPVVSPDSFVRASRTLRGVDPNRSFPGPSTGRSEATTGPTRLLIHNSEQYKLFATLDIHAFGEVFLLPWGHQIAPITGRDWQLIQYLARESARNTRYRALKLTDFLGGRTAAGGSSDYWYGQRGALAMGLEIARSKQPATELIPDITNTLSQILDQYFAALLQIEALND